MFGNKKEKAAMKHKSRSIIKEKEANSKGNRRKEDTAKDQTSKKIENGRQKEKKKEELKKMGTKGANKDELEGERKRAKKKKEREEEMECGKEKERKEEEGEHYEEDFEDYESDFEEEEEGEMNRPAGSMEKEAKNGQKEQEESLLLKKLATSKKAEEREKEPVGRRIDENGESIRDQNIFVPKQREFEIGQERGIMGMKLKEEGAKEWMADYFREVAGQNEQRKQTWTQTDGPEINVGSQTEMVESESRGAQFGRTIEREEKNVGGEGAGQHQRRLDRIVQEAGQLMVDLLDLSPSSGIGQPLSLANNSNLAFSSRYSTLLFGPLFRENRLSAIALKNPQTICLCTFIAQSEDPMQNRRSFSTEISLEDPNSQGDGILFCCDQEVAFLSYSPRSSYALFAALKDGNLVAWDLRRGGAVKLKGSSQLKERAILMPTANTAFGPLFDEQSREGSSKANWADLRIVGMEVLGEGGGRAIAHLIILHESGLIRCWTAMDNAMGGEGQDIGGPVEEGTIQLMLTSTVHSLPRHNPKELEFANCLALHSQLGIFVGTSKGIILRVNRISGRSYSNNDDGRPAMYIADQEGNSEVTSLKFANSKKESSIFAATTSDQRIFLFNSASNEPMNVLFFQSSANFATQLLPSGILLEWSSRDENILHSVHAGEQIVTWRRMGSYGKWRETSKEVCQFYLEFRARIQCSLVWLDQSGNEFMAFGLSNGEVHVHALT